jgi:hypothetical protein
MVFLFDDNFVKRLAKDYGRTESFQFLDKFGYNASVSNSTEEDVWVQGGTLSFLSSAETMNIASTSVEDDADKDPAGTGAYQIRVEGLDGNYNLISENVTMDGTSNVLTANSYLRINRMYINGTVGSNGTNVGTITATASSSATVQADIGIGLGQTEKSQYTVPAGFTAYIIAWGVDVGKGDDIDSTLQTRDNSTNSGWRVRRRLLVYQTDVEEETFITAGEKSDVRVRAKAGTNNNIAVNTHYEMFVLKNYS